MEGATGERAALADVERWFLSRGLPHFIDGYSARRDVFTRALPGVALTVELEFLHDVVSEVRQAFAVRAVYLEAVRAGRAGT
ncbi:MAG: hypothetical protein ACLGI2_06015 [Acidimicrobiia bacterium]